jgi:hypothetical protein
VIGSKGLTEEELHRMFATEGTFEVPHIIGSDHISPENRVCKGSCAGRLQQKSKAFWQRSCRYAGLSFPRRWASRRVAHRSRQARIVAPSASKHKRHISSVFCATFTKITTYGGKQYIMRFAVIIVSTSSSVLQFLLRSSR